TRTALALIAVGAVPVLAFAAWLAVIVGKTVALPGGGDVTNILAPASGHAKALLDIGMFVLAVTGLIFVIVFGLLATAIARFRESGSDHDLEPPHVHRRTDSKIGTTIIRYLLQT